MRDEPKPLAVLDRRPGVDNARGRPFDQLLEPCSHLVGIADVTALLAIAGVNASMILFGWLQEKYERPRGGGWLPFWFGCIAGAVPWVAVVLYVVAPQSTSEASPPGFVYGIVASLFLFFNVFALNRALDATR